METNAERKERLARLERLQKQSGATQAEAPKRTRSGLGANPLSAPMDLLVPKQSQEATPEPLEDRKERYTLNLPMSLIEQAKNASWHTRKPLTQIAEEGIRREIKRLEQENGGPFTQRTSSLPVGRPLT